MGSFFCCLSGIKTVIVNVKNFLRKSGNDASPLSQPCTTIAKLCGQRVVNCKSNDTIYVFNLMVTKLASITTISCSLPQTTFKIMSHENRVFSIVHKINLFQYSGDESPPNEMDKITYELKVIGVETLKLIKNKAKTSFSHFEKHKN